VWRWVARRRACVAIDVNLGRVQTHDDGVLEVVQEQGRAPVGFDSAESAQRLLSREASHLYVVPLHAQGGEVEGMISIEAECQSAIAQDFIWPECGASLELLAAVAAPYLAALPPRPAAATPTDDFLPVVGPSMHGFVRMLDFFARQDETILLGGPTGAGKSRLARWCHERSRRRAHPFEALDLLSVPEDLQMAELTGWRRGAFTGAVADNAGAIARADGGTLFLDEIDKLSLKAQAGLLHFLDERTYTPLGAGTKRADIRFLVGTNADLPGAVRAGQFREDLYYRINVLPIKVPPLAERRDEIPLWASYMLGRRHREAGAGGEARISGGAERLLAAQRWQGNLRQLDNIVRRAYALATMELGGAPREVVLKEEHLTQALGYEPGPRTSSGSLVDAFRGAGAAYVLEAERLAALGSSLDLDLSDAMRGFVLGAAIERLGSKDAAFRLLGKGSLVANRNQHKALRRELERIEALCRAVGHPTTPFADLDGDP